MDVSESAILTQAAFASELQQSQIDGASLIVEEQDIHAVEIHDLSTTEHRCSSPVLEVFHSFEELNREMCHLKEALQAHFVTIQKTKNFGNEDLQVDPKSRIYWENIHVQHGVPIQFTGVPYVFVGRKVLNYYLLKDTGLIKRSRYRSYRDAQLTDDHNFVKRRQYTHNTEHVDCPAEIYITHVIRFEQFKIAKDTEKRRRNASTKLREALKQNPQRMKGVHHYMTRFPKYIDHKFHVTGGETELQTSDAGHFELTCHAPDQIQAIWGQISSCTGFLPLDCPPPTTTT